MTVSVKSEQFAQEVERAELPVVVDVYATWCGPCQQMAPIFEELSKELGSQYKFVKLNIDEARDIATKYRVASIPTFLFFKGGKLVGTELGYMSKSVLKDKITSILK